MDQKLLTDFRSELLDSRFGAKAISTIAESKRFPLHEMRDDVAFQIINDELYLDGNARQNLATFCQTWDDENYPWWHWLLERENPRTLQVCT